MSPPTCRHSWHPGGAEALLADEAQAVSAMELYMLRTATHFASVRIENLRRHEREVCALAEWQGEPGREWRLLVMISPSLAPPPLEQG